MLVDEVEGTNQLVKCKIYLSSKLFITELECLVFFNHNITFPFLNCFETSTQAELLVIMQQLYKDLNNYNNIGRNSLFQFMGYQLQLYPVICQNDC